jgi:hypothetical protein
LAETARADGNVFETIKYYLLSQEPEKALPIGIDFVKGKFLVGSLHLRYICSFGIFIHLDNLPEVQTQTIPNFTRKKITDVDHALSPDCMLWEDLETRNGPIVCDTEYTIMIN